MQRTAIAIVLPPRENFTAVAAGAIAMVVRRLAGGTPGTVVFGSPQRSTFPGIAYQPVTGTLSLLARLRRLAPAVVEVHQQPRLALLLSLLFPAAKIMLFIHNDPQAMRGLKSAVARRLMLARLHRVICVSHYLAARYRDRLPTSGTGPAILPNPLTLADLPPPATARQPCIVFAGRIVPDKAPDTFIAACAIALPQLPGWSACLFGGDRFGPQSPETSYVAHIRNAATAAGIACAGPRPNTEVLAALAGAAIAVVPSRWAEPFGLAALEAIASGAALITTGCGGLREVARDAALYVEPDDPAALAAGILTLARDPTRRATLAGAGFSQARQFDTPVIVAALEKLRRTG